MSLILELVDLAFTSHLVFLTGQCTVELGHETKPAKADQVDGVRHQRR